jgi:hypothetical protein
VCYLGICVSSDAGNGPDNSERLLSRLGEITSPKCVFGSGGKK